MISARSREEACPLARAVTLGMAVEDYRRSDLRPCPASHWHRALGKGTGRGWHRVPAETGANLQEARLLMRVEPGVYALPKESA
jgi:hypothetical protein